MKKNRFNLSQVTWFLLMFSMLIQPAGFSLSPLSKDFPKRTFNVIENYNRYSQLNLCEFGLEFTVFDYAIKGFESLKAKGFFNNTKLLTIIDFSKAANEKRLFVLDLEIGKVLFNTYVAHGKATGENFAKYFSNKPSSLKSSLGFYETAETYIGKHGYSLKLNGLEKGINDQVNNRSIVIHGADYVSESFIKENGTIGRSWGCPAVPEYLSKPLIDSIKHGTCIFVYADDDGYKKKSKVPFR